MTDAQLPGLPPPPPAAPDAPQQPGPYVPKQVSGFAIASLVFGIIGGIVFGYVFGFVALRRIKRRGQSGRGMAIAGIVLSTLWIVVIAIVGVIALTTSARRDDTGKITKAGSVSADDLRVGDCIASFPTDEEIFSVDAVPCGEPHEGEVFASITLAGGEDWPGIDSVSRRADAGCSRRLSIGGDDGPAVSYLHPTEASWETLDDREVTCIAIFEPRRRGLLSPK